MKQIFMITGPMRSGKDFFADKLVNMLPDNKAVMHFAYPLKDIISTTLKIKPQTLDEWKNEEKQINVLTELGIYVPISDFRTLLQRFGTEAMKKWFGKDVWVQLLIQRMQKGSYDYVIIPDWRFPEEYEAVIKAYPNLVTTIKIIDANAPKSNHISEKGMDMQYDYVFNNTEKNPDKLGGYVEKIVSERASKTN